MAERPDLLTCLSCGFRNLPVARYCDGCGQIHRGSGQTHGGIDCHSCGFSNPRNSRFCSHCDAHLIHTGDETSGTADCSVASHPPESSTSAARITRLGIPQSALVLAAIRAGFAPSSTLGTALSATRAHLLASGAVTVVLAQLGLYFSVNPNAKAPLGYLFLLALGVLLFALGSLGVWLNRTPYAGKSGREALPRELQIRGDSSRSSFRIAGLLLGTALTVVLWILLGAGSESGNAIFIWIASLVGFGFMLSPQLVNGNFRPLALLKEWLQRYRGDHLIVALLVATFLALNIYDLQHWYYSAIGDEYLFYEHAKLIIEEGVVRPFSQEGVYDKHPVLNSVFQAAVMRVVGADYFGWTFSEVLNAALTIPAVYVLGRVLGGRLTAICAAAIFAFSHYIFAFSHTGYTSLSALPVAAWAMVLFVFGWRTQNPLLLYAVGLLAGFGFYTHYSGRAIMPIVLLSALALGGPRRLLSLWPLAFGFALTVAPTFIVEQEHVFTRMFGQVVGGYPEAVTGSTWQRLLDNIELNLPAFNYNASVHTYVYGPLFDPISASLAALGIAFALGHIGNPANRIILIWFGIAFIMTGVLSPYPHVAITRLLFAVPPLALLGGLLAGRMSNASLGVWTRLFRIPRQSAIFVGVGGILSLILLLNLWQFWHLTPTVFPHSQEAVALGAFRSDDCREDAIGTVFAGQATGAGSLMSQMLGAFYPNGPMPRQIYHHLLSDKAWLPEPPLRCVIFLNPGAPQASQLQDELARRYPEGRFSTFFNPSGITSVVVFSR